MPATDVLLESARWLEARSPDPHHPCCAGHRDWAAALAAGYATALAVHDAETTENEVTPIGRYVVHRARRDRLDAAFTVTIKRAGDAA